MEEQSHLAKKYNSFSQEFLTKEFANRKKGNPSYSLRALERDIGISKTTIQDVLNGGRRLSPSAIKKLQATLSLDDEILKSLNEDNSSESNQGRTVLLDDEFNLIKDWYYLAILNLAKLPENKCNADWVAERLAISLETAEAALNNLLDIGLIENRNGKIYRTSKPLTTSMDIPSEAIREHHRQSLEKAIEALSKIPVNFRDYTTVTYPIHPRHLLEVKKLIIRFHRKLGKFLKTKNATEVYRLNIQFFPLTQMMAPKEPREE